MEENKTALGEWGAKEKKNKEMCKSVINCI